MAAILAFFPGRKELRLKNIGFYLGIIAAVLRAGMGLSYKYGFLHGADRNGVVIINSLFWIAGGLIYALFREKSPKIPDRKMLFYGVISGILVAGIVFFMAASLQYGDAGIVLPIAQMSFLATFRLSAIFLKEQLNARKIIALICGALAIILLTIGC